MYPLSAPNFDTVEVARGALAFLSFSTKRSAHEVHTGRVQEIFSRAGLPQHALMPALEALYDLKEVERLEHGYWLPTPARRIPLNAEACLLVSIAPTTELQRHFQSVRRAGLGRLANTQQVKDLPSQSLQSWIGAWNTDTTTWAQALIESTISEFKPSIASPDLEAFSVKATSRSNHGTRHEPTWLPSMDRRVSVWHGVKLLRSRISSHHYRYFLGRISGNSTLFEGHIVQDNLRLQYGLASLLGQPLTSSVVLKGDLSYLRLPLAAPRSVKRVLSALCESDPKSFGYRWSCREVEGWPTVNAVLKDLGCEIENNE